jgi:LacI family transcriptional regulator
MMDGIEAEADRLGFRAEEFWLSEPEADQRALSRMLYNRGIRGVLLLPFHRSIRRLKMDFGKISVISLGRSQAAQGSHSVVTNPFEAVRLAMRVARERGYRRPGLALETFQDARADGRYHGAYYLSQETLTEADRVPPLAGSPAHLKAVSIWFERHRPDVILSYGTWVLDWLRCEGLAVPDQVGFIDLNRSNAGSTSTGVCQNYGEMGRTAVDLLVDLVNKDERGIPRMRRQHIVDITWMESGGTLR